MSRPHWIQTHMKQAENMAERSLMPTQVGAVIIQDRHSVSDGYNGPPSGFFNKRVEDNQWNEVHAEMNAIAFAARRGISTDGASMYTTVAPCIHCAKAIVQAGIKTVYYYDVKANNQEVCPDGIPLLEEAGVMCFPITFEEIHGNTGND